MPGDVLRLGDHVGVVDPRSGGGDPPLEVTELKVGKHTSFAGRALRAAIERAKKRAVAPDGLSLAIEAPHVTELRNIEDKLKVESARFTLIPSFAVRRSEVIQRIQKHKPAVVHFSGHGTPDGELIFEDESGGPAPAPVEAIGDMFRILSSTGIRCVVLNACYSARQAEIISRHVACVVGMGRTVRDEAASIFAAQFYTSLLEGCSFDKAFKLARVQIDLNLMSDSDVPRLLCRKGVDPRVEGLVG